MYRKLLNIIIFIILSVPGFSIIAIAGDGIKDNSYLFGARPIGLSNAFTAVDGDLSAVSFNPAGIASINRNVFSSFYNNPLQLNWIRQYNISFGIPIKLRTMNMMNAISYFANDVDHFDESYTAYYPDYNGIKQLESSILYSAGFAINKQSLIGFNLGYNKVSGNDNQSAKGFLFDAGYIGKIRDDISLGISLKNLYNRMKWGDGRQLTKDIEYRLGVKYNYVDRLTLSGDVAGGRDEELKTINGGAEFIVWESVRVSDELRGQQMFKRSASKLYPENLAFLIRLGIEKDLYFKKDMRYSAGLGFGIGMTKVDYALKIDNQGISNNQHYFSLGFEFGNDISKKYIEGNDKVQQPPLPQSTAAKQNLGYKQTKPQQQKRSEIRRPEIGVINFVNVMNNKPYQWLTAGIPDMIIKGLESKKNIGFRDRAELSNMVSLVSKNPLNINGEISSQIGILVNADYIIIGWFEIRNEKEITISCRLFNTDRRSEVWSGSVKGTVMQVFALISQINEAMSKAIK